METITNVTNAVSKTIFGSSEPTTKPEEPQSGVQGDTSKGEPFDGGNMDEQQKSLGGEQKPLGGEQPQPLGGEQPKPLGGEQPKPSTEQKLPTPNDAADPGAIKDSSHGAGDHTKTQSDTRSPSDPNTEPEKAEAANDVDDSGSGPNSTKVEGKGPRPIADLAKAHGGDAGAIGKDGKDGDAATDDKPKDGKGDDDGPEKESKGEGTGEQYVKSSGLKADGGDFDASNPGAGREADRLLEAKGIHHEVGPPKLPEEESAASESSSATPDKKKRSLGEKIKAKLHRNSNS